MEKRFFLYRIDAFGADTAVDQAVQLTPAILADSTDTASAVTDQAAKTAQPAAHFAFSLPLVKHGFFHTHFPRISY